MQSFWFLRYLSIGVSLVTIVIRSVGQGFGGPGQRFKEGDDQCKKQINVTQN